MEAHGCADFLRDNLHSLDRAASQPNQKKLFLEASQQPKQRGLGRLLKTEVVWRGQGVVLLSLNKSATSLT
jgi:hypothetical protein